MNRAALSLSFLLTLHAQAQTILYALRAGGELLALDPSTGAATPVAASAVPCITAFPDLYAWRSESIITTGNPAAPNLRYFISRWTGAVWRTQEGPPPPPGYTLRALYWDGAILGADAPGGIDLFARPRADHYDIVGPTGRSRLNAILFDGRTYTYFALGDDEPGGALYRLEFWTGAATLIASGGFGDATHAFTLMPDGTLLACGSNLIAVDPVTGETSLRGPTGFTDIRGLVPITREFPWYLDCVQSTTPPVLNVLDFNCFLQRFTAGDPYANCDQSTTPPVLNVLDFNCFLNHWAACCTIP